MKFRKFCFSVFPTFFTSNIVRKALIISALLNNWWFCTWNGLRRRWKFAPTEYTNYDNSLISNIGCWNPNTQKADVYFIIGTFDLSYGVFIDFVTKIKGLYVASWRRLFEFSQRRTEDEGRLDRGFYITEKRARPLLNKWFLIWREPQ